MKKLLSSILAVAALVSIQAFAQDEAAEESPSLLAQLKESTKCSIIPTSIKLSLDYKSRYLSDGRVINPKQMLFGEIDLYWDFTNDGVYAGIWGANDLNDYNRGSGIKYEPEEFDYYIGYWYEWGDLGDVVKSVCVDVSYTYWDYPSRSGWECVGEQQNTFTVDVSAPLGVDAVSVKPGVKVNWDPENEKIYGDVYVGLGKSFEDCKCLSLGTKFELFWGNGNYYVLDNPQLTTFIWTVNADVSVGNFTIGPFAQLVWAVGSDTRDFWKERGDFKGSINDNSKSGVNTCYGVSASFKF